MVQQLTLQDNTNTVASSVTTTENAQSAENQKKFDDQTLEITWTQGVISGEKAVKGPAAELRRVQIVRLIPHSGVVFANRAFYKTDRAPFVDLGLGVPPDTQQKWKVVGSDSSVGLAPGTFLTPLPCRAGQRRSTNLTLGSFRFAQQFVRCQDRIKECASASRNVESSIEEDRNASGPRKRKVD